MLVFLCHRKQIKWRNSPCLFTFTETSQFSYECGLVLPIISCQKCIVSLEPKTWLRLKRTLTNGRYLQFNFKENISFVFRIKLSFISFQSVYTSVRLYPTQCVFTVCSGKCYDLAMKWTFFHSNADNNHKSWLLNV